MLAVERRSGNHFTEICILLKEKKSSIYSSSDFFGSRKSLMHLNLPFYRFSMIFHVGDTVRLSFQPFLLASTLLDSICCDVFSVIGQIVLWPDSYFGLVTIRLQLNRTQNR